MNAEVRLVATAAALAALVGLMIAAWNGYRSVGFLLMLDAMPLCG